MMKLPTIELFLGATLLAGAASCAPLQHAPWSKVHKGTWNIGASTGWAFYNADVEAEGTSGVLKPGGKAQTGSDNTDLTPRYGGALKANYFFADHHSIGVIAEMRRFKADSVSPLSAELQPDDFTTYHFLLSYRYWPNPFPGEMRLRPFFGLDLGYVPGVTFDNVEVTYPASTGIPSENVKVDGDAFFTVAPVAGLSYLLRDNLTFELGTFYEISYEPSQAELKLKNLGGATANVDVWPQGLIVFLGLTYYL